VSYLVPGVASENGEDAFELVDLDLRLLYRIGMTDQAAIAARASLSDPEALIRAYAGAWLVRTLSTRTLPALLREDTRRLQQDMAVALQHDLDQANSGLELLGVLIDAIHPPPGAAGAYHGVQAAEIRAAAELAKERRAAVTLTGEAREKAAMTLNLAAAHAQEMRANAAIERIRFLTEVQAQHDAGDGLGLDRRLHSLERSLAGGTLTILDRRIALQSGTTLDFRPASANSAAASDAADADIPVGETPSSSSPASDAPEAPGSTNPPNSVNPEDGP
jgi:regulator of protease activity HflC (stomatin/prohibitin superfamily)